LDFLSFVLKQRKKRAMINYHCDLKIQDLFLKQTKTFLKTKCNHWISSEQLELSSFTKFLLRFQHILKIGQVNGLPKIKYNSKNYFCLKMSFFSKELL
jgi:hypothetical protein